jgi:hypothetical protein
MDSNTNDGTSTSAAGENTSIGFLKRRWVVESSIKPLNTMDPYIAICDLYWCECCRAIVANVEHLDSHTFRDLEAHHLPELSV